MLALLATAPHLLAQGSVAVPFSSERWQFREYTQRSGLKEHVLETYLGQACVRLVNTDAVLSDAAFTHGIIEYDAAFTAERGGVGISFREQDPANTEVFYVRPHQSGNPDALQYMRRATLTSYFRNEYGQ